jgi:hypothetical protein
VDQFKRRGNRQCFCACNLARGGVRVGNRVSRGQRQRGAQALAPRKQAVAHGLDKKTGRVALSW